MDIKCAKKKKADEEDEDRLSQLPECLSLHILSFLPLKDAARTSVLSKIWTKRWLLMDVLDFDTSLAFSHPDVVSGSSSLPSHTPEYVDWVCSVLRSHQATTREGDRHLGFSKLRVCMRIDDQFQEELDGWIAYAFASRVQSLEFDFSVYSKPKRLTPNRCSFDDMVLAQLDFKVFSHLRSLALAGVMVSRKGIMTLLRHSPVLECLKVCSSKELRRLDVSGPSLALKHLEIRYCPCLTRLIVFDTSLVSLTISWMTNVFIVKNPKLVDVRVTEWLPGTKCVLAKLDRCFTTVQTLAFDTTYWDDYERIDNVKELREVKQLTLTVDPLQEDSLIRLSTFLCLSPKLEKLVLQFVYWYSGSDDKKMVPSRKKTKLNTSPKFPVTQRIKVLELREYYGEVAEDEAIKYILKHAITLPQRVVFDPRFPEAITTNIEPRVGVETDPEKRAEQLERLLPKSVEFVAV